MKLGKIRTDDDGHNFLIPVERVGRFDRMIAKLEGRCYTDDPDAFDEFSNEFEGFRIDGVEDLIVVMKKEAP